MRLRRIGHTLFLTPKPSREVEGGLVVKMYDGETFDYSIKKGDNTFQLPDDILLKDIAKIFVANNEVKAGWR